MTAKHRTLRYLAFFEALAELEEGSVPWRALSAGLVTLRLVEGWMARGGSETGGDLWGLQTVRQQVERVDATDPARSILAGILAEVERPGAADPQRVVPRLMAYGRSLDFGGRWALAAELYETVLAHVDVARDGDLATAAQFRLAYCRRVLGQLDEAEMAYAAAGQLASSQRDDVGMLRSEVGVAKVVMARGNVPSAERMLDSVVARTDAALRTRADTAMREFRATVLHDRAVLAYVRQEHERGIALLDQALADTTSPSARDRVIADIALGFMNLGVRSAARDAFLIVAATAEEQYSRWSATVNLMQLAAEDGMEPAFEQYRRQLAGQPLTPEQAGDFHHIAAMGLRRFGRVEQARTTLAEGIALAERHGLNALLFNLEREREAQEAGERAERRRSAEPPPSVAGVATAMRELRERVLVSAGR